MNRRSLLAASLVMALLLTSAAALNAQGPGGQATGQPGTPPSFDETFVVPASTSIARFTLPADVASAFDGATVDIQVLEPPGLFGLATTNFLTVSGQGPAAALWSQFETTFAVFAPGFSTLAPGQEIRARIWLHR